MQDEDLIRDERDREDLRRVVEELAALREMCRRSPALIDVVDEMRKYLRECLIATLSPGIDGATFTLDELAEVANPEEVEATKSVLYKRIMERLHISRTQLDQRLKRIHRLMREGFSVAGT